MTQKIVKPRLPFTLITKEEADKRVKTYDGVASCPRCGRKHPVGYGKTDGVINKTLGFVTCKGRTYLIAIDNFIL